MRLRLSHILLVVLLNLIALTASVNTNDLSKTINHVNLLLPVVYNPQERGINFTLIGYNGCYEWYTSHPKILKVDNIQDADRRCNSSAQISLLTNEPDNNIMLIFARDKETRDVLKCETRIAKIHRIEILTKLRTIDINDVQTLELIAYDEQGNAFSSLEGLRFEWTIQKTDLLEHIPLKDSTIKSTELRKRVEAQQFQSDMIVVKGLRKGQTVVHVKLKEKGYPTEISTSVVVNIIEEFTIFPESPVYTLPYSRVQFSLTLIKNDVPLYDKIIRLPDPNYLWYVDNKAIANMVIDGKLDTNNKLGTVTVKVADKETPNNYVESAVYVVFPIRMDIKIKEFSETSWEIKEFIGFNNKIKEENEKFDNNWNLIKDKLYYLRIYLYDDKDNQIYISDNTVLKFIIPPEDFEIIETKGHEIVVKPITLSKKKRITATLLNVTLGNNIFTPP